MFKRQLISMRDAAKTLLLTDRELIVDRRSPER